MLNPKLKAALEAGIFYGTSSVDGRKLSLEEYHGIAHGARKDMDINVLTVYWLGFCYFLVIGIRCTDLENLEVVAVQCFPDSYGFGEFCLYDLIAEGAININPVTSTVKEIMDIIYPM